MSDLIADLLAGCRMAGHPSWMALQSSTTSGERAERLLLASIDADVRGWAQDCLPPGVTLCGFADSGSDVAELARSMKVDVCLLDIGLPGDALAALRALAESAPAVHVVAWAASDANPGLLEAIAAGAIGCIVGTPDREALASTLTDVVAGRPTLPPAVVTRMVFQLRLL
jgi:DNA-binding NarL/FixJ family response regulator